jgi:hypothetical protein
MQWVDEQRSGGNASVEEVRSPQHPPPGALGRGRLIDLEGESTMLPSLDRSSVGKPDLLIVGPERDAGAGG